MKIKFNGMSNRVSKGMYLVPGELYEVTAEVGTYLTKTFSDIEVVAEEPKAKTEPAPKAEPKVGTKVTPKDK